MKLLLIILSGVLLVSNEPNKAQFEVITGTKVVKQGIVPVVTKKNTSTKKISAKKSKKNKKNVKKSQKAKKYKTKKKKTTKNTKSNTKNTKSNTKKKVIKKKTTKKKTYKQTTRVRYNVGEIQAYAHQLVREYGWTEEDYQSLVLIVYKESSWRPEAINKKSGSCGLFQAYPCSKMAKYGSDYRTNYKTQMKFGFEYIKARYQNPTKAWAFWQSHHWY